MQDFQNTLSSQIEEDPNRVLPPTETKQKIDQDFTGFQFGEYHSSYFGLIRVSDGRRYTETLLPEFTDKKIKVPGGDGFYYFGSEYNQKNINVSFAFDSLTERKLRELRKWLGDKKIKNLVFDESPYKGYNARVSNSVSISSLCFEEGGKRVYKGEGSIQFVCLEPFARTRTDEKNVKMKFIANFPDVGNIGQWEEASGMLAEQGNIDICQAGAESYFITVYNPGDLDTDFQLKIPYDSLKTSENLRINLYDHGGIYFSSGLKSAIAGKTGNLIIDTATNLVYDEATGELYNQYITSGFFFKIPANAKAIVMYVPCKGCEISYDYLYY